MSEKINLRIFPNEKTMMNLIKENAALRTFFIETETWEEFLPIIDKVFVYNEFQLEYVKNDFNKRRGL